MKKIVIDRCNECPYQIEFYYVPDDKKFRCQLDGRVISDAVIGESIYLPKWCPLDED